LYVNSSTLLKIYAFFPTPLGFENLTLGSYYFPVIYPISVTWYNGSIYIFNNGNVTLYNITVHFGEENVKVQKLSPKERVSYPVSTEPKIVYIIFYYDNTKFSYWQRVYGVPLASLSVMYQFANITKLPSTANSYIATLILYIKNAGDRNITNVYIVVQPNGDTVTPLFYLISQILTNETIAVPFTVYTTKNTVFNILILYYIDNQTYIENVTVPINYVKPTPGEIISNYAGKYIFYEIYGIPIIVIAFILVIILISVIPRRGRKKPKT